MNRSCKSAFVLLSAVAGILAGCARSVPRYPPLLKAGAYPGPSAAASSDALVIQVAGIRSANNGAYVDVYVQGPSALRTARLLGDWAADRPQELFAISSERGEPVELLPAIRQAREYLRPGLGFTMASALGSAPYIGPGTLAGPTLELEERAVVQTIPVRTVGIHEGSRYRVTLTEQWHSVRKNERYVSGIEALAQGGELVLRNESGLVCSQ